MTSCELIPAKDVKAQNFVFGRFQLKASLFFRKSLRNFGHELCNDKKITFLWKNHVGSPLKQIRGPGRRALFYLANQKNGFLTGFSLLSTLYQSGYSSCSKIPFTSVVKSKCMEAGKQEESTGGEGGESRWHSRFFSFFLRAPLTARKFQ